MGSEARMSIGIPLGASKAARSVFRPLRSIQQHAGYRDPLRSSRLIVDLRHRPGGGSGFDLGPCVSFWFLAWLQIAAIRWPVGLHLHQHPPSSSTSTIGLGKYLSPYNRMLHVGGDGHFGVRRVVIRGCSWCRVSRPYACAPRPSVKCRW